MYYILSESKKIIAADNEFLEICEAVDINELSKKIILEEIKIKNVSENRINVKFGDVKSKFSVSKTPLSSYFGELVVVKLKLEDVVSKEKNLNEEDLVNLIIKEDEENLIVSEDLSIIDKENFKETEEFIIDDNKELEVLEKDEISLYSEEEITIDKDILVTDTKDEPSIDKDEISFDLEEDVVIIETKDEPSIDKDEISFDLEEEIIVTETKDEPAIEKDEISLDLEEDIVIVETKDEPAIEKDEISLDLEDNVVIVETKDKQAIEKDEISLDLEDISVIEKDEISLDLDSVLNTKINSKKIGISEEDYISFIKNYKDMAFELKEDLLGEDIEKKNSSIKTILHMENVLHLNLLNNIKLENESIEKDKINLFYETISKINNIEVKDDPTEKIIEPNEEIIEEGFGTISLDNIKPIHFDFQLDEAARDLSLPIELIEEFVNDFIAQAHIETENLLEAYKKGDLKTIQAIGHLLKGTSSNLRINALSDTLFKIQFCEDVSELDAFVKDYWGYLLSLEIQMRGLKK